MRVLILTKTFPPRCCGVGDYACRLAETLAVVGDDVVVLTEPRNGPRHSDVALRELPLRGWRDLQPVLQAIVETAPDRVQLEYSGYGWSRWGFSFWLNGLVIALRRRGIPVSIGLHETYIRFVDHPRLVAISVLQRIHVWLLVATADGVYLNMPERVRGMRLLLPWRRSRIHYRPNSSTVPVFPLGEQARRGLRLSRGAGPDDFVVATFGLFQSSKNLEAVLEAIARARSPRTLRLWMLGDPAGARPRYIQALREQARALGIENQVFWSGYLTPADVSAHLQAADLFVLPQPDGHLTRSSAFMAAAAHGRPVIAVRNQKNQSEFTSGENVWLVTKSTAVELAAALEALEREPALAARLGKNLGRLYRERFDWPATTGARSEAEDTHAPALDSRGTAQPARKS